MFKTLLMYHKGKDQSIPEMVDVLPEDVETFMKNVKKGLPFSGKDKDGNPFYVQPREYRFIKFQDPTPSALPQSGGSSRAERMAETIGAVVKVPKI